MSTVAEICVIRPVSCLSSCVTGCLLLCLLCLYKQYLRVLWSSVSVVVMAVGWSSSLESTCPPDRSSRCQVMDARRVFASSKNTCYLYGRWPCFSHHSHPGHLAPGGLMVEAISEAFVVCWSNSLCGNFSGFPLDGFWRDGIVFVAKHIREKSRCKNRICDVLDPSISSYNKPFPPWMYLDYSPFGVTRFVSLYQP